MSNMDFAISQRARAIAFSGSIHKAMDDGSIADDVEVSFAEALVLGLLKQDVRKFLCVFGHGSTELGNVLRIYQEEGAVQCFNFRNEVAMAHVGSALRWIYDEPCAVVTSIGPGALQAFSGSLLSASNGIGLYHIYGDETTHGEGYNMQQVPRYEQSIYQKLTGCLGESYQLHTAGGLRDALRLGSQRVFHPNKAGPFYFLFPINTQPEVHRFNLKSLPEKPKHYPTAPVQRSVYANVAKHIQKAGKIVIKAGGGCRAFHKELLKFAELSKAAVVLSPNSTGVMPDNHPQNMHVGGSKGSISGNYAMQEAELLIAIGTRAVCQSDCSGVGYPNVDHVININADQQDVHHYNKTLALQGDIGAVLKALTLALEEMPPAPGVRKNKAQWLESCSSAKQDWVTFKNLQYENGIAHDAMWCKSVMTQPTAIKIVSDFAKSHDALKLFDAGDVQANGFQVVEDDTPFTTYTDSGSSYMGFATSAVTVNGLVDSPKYAIAFTGDGSFMMNPQTLIDAVEHNARGMIVIFDNRRMGAISSLQMAQYEREFMTNDSVEVDYVQLASSIKGVKAMCGGSSPETLRKALEESYLHEGLSVVVVPVYYQHTDLNGLGAHGSWNVGNWVENVQKAYHEQNL